MRTANPPDRGRGKASRRAGRPEEGGHSSRTAGLDRSPPAPPTADRATLSRWFTALHRETRYLRGSAVALRGENLPRFEKVNGRFFRYGAKSNNVVVSFGFNYCAFKPSRYE